MLQHACKAGLNSPAEEDKKARSIQGQGNISYCKDVSLQLIKLGGFLKKECRADKCTTQIIGCLKNRLCIAADLNKPGSSTRHL